MPSFQDSAVIFLLALLLFGPKKLPELARYIGKLMAEFRRASSEFRMQMDDEFRQIEQAEQQKKIAAMEAAAPLAPAITADIPDPEHPHLQPIAGDPDDSHTPHIPEVPSTLSLEPEETPGAPSQSASSIEVGAARPEPLPIASSGDLHLMPPSTGLPVPRPLGSFFDSIPATSDPAQQETETQAHG